MFERRLDSLWKQLQGKKPHFPHFLSDIYIDGLRGINDLQVVLDFPVSVIAGGNASGKTTVLFAAACAYKVPGAGTREYVPSTLFPDYRPPTSGHADVRPEVVLEFNYATPEGRRSMRWRRAKGWNRSFLGRKGVTQPERQLYLRTLSNRSNPSEVPDVLGMSRLKTAPTESCLNASQIEFARQILPFRYAEVVAISRGSKSLLFAAQDRGTGYSELHMATGERAILRLAREVAQLQNALILIDTVESGLHPWVQQLLMLQLQQLALRNDLQIIVTSHSPIVLDSVPPNGRVFLDRNYKSGKVTVQPAYRDLVQDALYGHSRDILNLLCEDEVAEGILRGILDVVLPRRNVKTETVRIGRDTGAGEFPTHASTLRKFGQIQNFVFLLDGDQREGNVVVKIAKAAGDEVPVYFLPGTGAPEIWVWERLQELPILPHKPWAVTATS